MILFSYPKYDICEYYFTLSTLLYWWTKIEWCTTLYQHFFFSTSQFNNKSLNLIYPPHPIFDKYIPLTNETQSELWISYLNNVKMLITVHTDSWQWAASILTYTSGQVSPPSHLCAMSLTNGRSSDLGITCLKWSKSWRRVDCSPKLRRWKTASL